MRLFNIGNILGGLKNRFGINYGRYFNPTASYSEVDELHKLTTIFSSPALLKVIMLQCDLFSLGKWQVEENGKVKDKDPVLKLLKNPNYFQSGKQLLWDFCFWNMLGNAVLYMRKNTTDTEQLRRTRQAIDNLARVSNLKLFWIKAHVGHEFNERADTLAKEATLNGIPHHVLRSRNSLKRAYS